MYTGVNPSDPIRPTGQAQSGALVERSRRLLRETQHASGSWPASPDFAPYGYSWFRDGSFIAEGASAAGLSDGHLVKWLGGHDVDGSLLAVAALYDVLPLDDPRVIRTVELVEERLTDGGVHRYQADTFYGGGQWPVLACLLAWHHGRLGNPARAAELLEWAAAGQDPAGAG